MNENSIAIIVSIVFLFFLAHFFLGKSERLKKLFYDASHLFLILLFQNFMVNKSASLKSCCFGSWYVFFLLL